MTKGKVLSFLIMLMALLLCVACSNNEEETDLLPVESDFIEYEVENLSDYTVDEEGNLYVFGQKEVTDEEDTFINYLDKYDLDGKLIFSKEVDVIMSSATAMTLIDDKIYLANSIFDYIEDSYFTTIYYYDIETGALEHFIDLDIFARIKQLVYMEDRIYFLGDMIQSTFYISRTEESYQSNGEKLIYYSFEDGQLYNLGIDIPISISPNSDGTLMIYSYLDNEGFSFIKYDPREDVAKVVANLDMGKLDFFATSGIGEEVIYSTKDNYRGLVISDINNMEVEAEIYSNVDSFYNKIYYMKGQVYFMNLSRNIVRLSLDSVQKDKKSINYISSGYLYNEPFGCGYMMDRLELDEEKFTLKVLAQDKDYDLCVMDTSDYSSYDIYKNGIFYPLNDIEGIDEYLDFCFPYVKEAATDESGNIWMLPINVDIRGLLVNEEYMEKSGIDLIDNITYEEFYREQYKMTDDLYQKTDISPNNIYINFFAEYFNTPREIDEDAFRNKLELFKKYYYKLPQKTPVIDWMNEIGWDEDFLYDFFRYEREYIRALEKIDRDEHLRFYSMPKINSTDKNIGTCTFMAVNPNSKNRDVVLEYLSDWIDYCMNQEKKPLYFKNTVEEKDSIEGSLYDLYENGEITFYIDRDIYSDGFWDVMEKDANIDKYIEETKRKLDIYFNE